MTCVCLPCRDSQTEDTPTFQPWEARRLTCFDPLEEGAEGEVNTDGHVLQYLTVNSFDFGEHLLLFVAADRHFRRFVLKHAVIDKRVVNKPEPSQPPPSEGGRDVLSAALIAAALLPVNAVLVLVVPGPRIAPPWWPYAFAAALGGLLTCCWAAF